MMKGKILVVDDLKDIVETICFCLQQDGYEVFSAFDGQQALELARREQPDLMVLDVMLPKENGYQVSRFVREDERAGIIKKRTRILMLTARTVPEKEREEFLQTWSGADVFLYKPFDVDELVRRIGELMSAEPTEPPSGVRSWVN